MHQAIQAVQNASQQAYTSARSAYQQLRTTTEADPQHQTDGLLLHEFGIFQPTEEQTNDDYVLLPTRNNGWGAAPNLDVYFTALYRTFYCRGRWAILCKSVVEIVTLVFTGWLSVALLIHVDWHALVSCTDDVSCRASLSDYYLKWGDSRWWWRSWVFLYAVLWFGYTAWASVAAYSSLQQATAAQKVLEERLGVSARRIERGAVHWDDVVRKLVELQQRGVYRVAINGDSVNALGIVQRIMRKENFMIALFNRGLLDLTIPIMPKKQLYCSTIEVRSRQCFSLF